MRSVEIFIIGVGVLMVWHSVIMSFYTCDLGLLGLVIGITMEEGVIGKMVMLSCMVVYVMGREEGDTSILMMMGVLGMLMMTEAKDMMMVYIGVEIVGLSVYVMAARERRGEEGTEAGIKYFVMGALSSGLLLMGIAIVYAEIGSTELEMMELARCDLIVIGLLFKVGAAPFHMWVPDVYEGAATLVTTYYAIVPKIAYLSVLIKLGGGEMLKFIGIFSILIGCFGAINQSLLKRLLGFSAISHIGFMLIGLGIGTMLSIQATISYMMIYVIMTVNSFAIVKSQGLRKIVEMRGMARRNGVLGMTMGLALMSIAGVPPLAGFYNKYLVIMSAVSVGDLGIALTAVVLSVVSAFYYVRVLRFIFFSDNNEVTLQMRDVHPRVGIVIGFTLFLIITIMMNPGVLVEVALPGVW